MIFSKQSKFCVIFLVTAFLLFAVGCGKKEAQSAKPTDVKTMKVIKKDVNLTAEYAGQIQGQNEVPVQARVAGHITEKLIKGGQMVSQGQPLFRIDDRQYKSAYLSAQAQYAQAEATLSNAKIDTQRYRELYKVAAIAEQMLTTQEATQRQLQALSDANRALAVKAQDDLRDTVVSSPISGRLYVDDVSVGTYVQPGVTTLVTVGVTDPIFAQFSISETEYLEMRKNMAGNDWGENVTITLSDGSVYPFSGKVTQIDRGMGSNSSSLAAKASFANPDNILLPGMFARVKIELGTEKDALLIPQRSVQQVLEKSYVMVLGAENKLTAKEVTLGKKIGNFWVVKSGLSNEDIVVVEGLTKVQDGITVNPKETTPEELSLSFE